MCVRCMHVHLLAATFHVFVRLVNTFNWQNLFRILRLYFAGYFVYFTYHSDEESTHSGVNLHLMNLGQLYIPHRTGVILPSL